MTATVSYGIMASRLGPLAPGLAPHRQLAGLEARGIAQAWLPHLLGLDPLPVIAAAAALTSKLRFGTAVTPTWPRHPLALMQEALAVQAVSDGRLALGIGVSDVPTIADVHGIAWRDPVGHLRDYLTVCAQARTGQVDFDGGHYRVHATLTGLPARRLPILVSGLNPRTIALAAELADGLITLLAPPSYLAQAVAPAIAARAGFRLVACVPAVVTASTRAAVSAAEQIYRPFWSYTGYAAMLRAAGCADITDVVVIGDAGSVATRLAGYAAAGVTDIAVSPFAVPGDPGAVDRTVSLTAALTAAAGD